MAVHGGGRQPEAGAGEREFMASGSRRRAGGRDAGRLYRLLRLLGRRPQTRDELAGALGLGVRGFYRDLEALRTADIEVLLQGGRYILVGKLAEATARLPFPDPGLTLGEAVQLSR